MLTQDNVERFVVVGFILGMLAFLGPCDPARAQPVVVADPGPMPLPPAEWTPGARLWAARVCFAEATWRMADCRAILWTVTHRWERIPTGTPYYDPRTGWRAWRWLDMLREYAAVGAPKRGRGLALTERQREIRGYPWGDVPGKPSRFQRGWADVRDFVTAWGEGYISDPCPEADHWGGSMDVPHPEWREISCGDTANRFYSLR